METLMWTILALTVFSRTYKQLKTNLIRFWQMFLIVFKSCNNFLNYSLYFLLIRFDKCCTRSNNWIRRPLRKRQFLSVNVKLEWIKISFINMFFVHFWSFPHYFLERVETFDHATLLKGKPDDTNFLPNNDGMN